MNVCIIDVVAMCIVLIDTYIHMHLYRSCYIFPYTITIVANMMNLALHMHIMLATSNLLYVCMSRNRLLKYLLTCDFNRM